MNELLNRLIHNSSGRNMFDALLAQVDSSESTSSISSFISTVTMHWQFCLLHFLNFAIWGAWFVVLGNMLNARGFSRTSIGRIYATMPIGAMITPLVIGPLADKYIAVEVLIGVSHLVGAILLFAMSKSNKPLIFYWLALFYAFAYSPTLGLVNSIIFAHDATIFGGKASELFPWIRVFGTFGWIAAGLSHILILKKNEPVNERPLLLASCLSFALGIFAFSLPHTPPRPAATPLAGESSIGPELGVAGAALQMFADNPVFFGVTFVGAIAMGLYFAFAALFLEKTGVPAKTVGPVMTLGQWIEIFFMLSLPFFLGPDQKNMNMVLLVGISAWALRFGFFAVGNPLAFVLGGIALHGICFDFFFGAGFINAEKIAPSGLTNTAQQFYGFLVYGLGMYLGSEGSGWLNRALSKQKADSLNELETNWRLFWGIPFVIVTIAAILFGVSVLQS